MQEQVVHLGDLTLPLNAEIVKDADLVILRVRPAEVERHLMLGGIASLFKLVTSLTRSFLFGNHAISVMRDTAERMDVPEPSMSRQL